MPVYPSESHVSVFETEGIKIESMTTDEDGASKIRLRSDIWTKDKEFVGAPRLSDFKVKREFVGNITDGEILIKALCWSVNTYQRQYDIPLGSTMIGEQVARVIDSRHPDFKEMSTVLVACGWRKYTVINPKKTYVRIISYHLMGKIPRSIFLGTLGLPGLLAYFSFLEICQPGEGDVVLVNDAAGCTGGLVGQLAKLRGCKVIGFACSKRRCDWMREMDFDAVINYKTVNAGAAVKRAAPDGVDIYIDLVGAKFTLEVIGSLKPKARMCMIGDVAFYRRQLPQEYKPDPYRFNSLINRQMYTHNVYDFEDKFEEAEIQLMKWMQEGKIRHHQTVYEGFDKLPDALIRLYDDDIVGKVLVRNVGYMSIASIVRAALTLRKRMKNVLLPRASRRLSMSSTN